MALPKPVTDRMRPQHGLITRPQCLAHGMTPDEIDGLVRRRAIERVHRGVYRQLGSAAPPEQTLLAAVLRAGRGARIDGAAALALHEVEGFSLDCPPSVVVPANRTVTGVDFTVHSGPDVQPGDRATVRGIPAVTPARAQIDIAVDGITARFRNAYDFARRKGLYSAEWLERRAKAQPEHPGAAIVLAFLDSGAGSQESDGERNLSKLLRFAPVQPEWGVWLFHDVRVDAIYRAARLVLEYDGRETHSLPEDIAADFERQRRLEAAGWRVIRVTKAMLRDDPVGTLAMIERIRLEREAEFAS